MVAKRIEERLGIGYDSSLKGYAIPKFDRNKNVGIEFSANDTFLE